MPQLKQRTVEGDLITLSRTKTDKPGKQFEYTVRKNGRTVPFPGGEGIFRKDVATDHFDRVVRKTKSSGGRQTRGMSGGGGLFSGGGDGGRTTADDTLGNT